MNRTADRSRHIDKTAADDSIVAEPKPKGHAEYLARYLSSRGHADLAATITINEYASGGDQRAPSARRGQRRPHQALRRGHCPPANQRQRNRVPHYAIGKGHGWHGEMGGGHSGD